MTQPRLLADYAAAPTPRERRHARTENRAAQLELVPIEHEDPAPAACPVCASTEHDEQRCPHGTAPALDLDTNSPERVAERRAMFAGFGWTTSS